jgi:hypothetical protein
VANAGVVRPPMRLSIDATPAAVRTADADIISVFAFLAFFAAHTRVVAGLGEYVNDVMVTDMDVNERAVDVADVAQQSLDATHVTRENH